MRKSILLGSLSVLGLSAAWAAPAFLPGRPQFTVLAPDTTAETQASGSVQTWTGSFSYNGGNYTFAMVGTDPSQGSATTTVQLEVVPVIFTFADGTVLDPTQNSCGDTDNAINRTMNSPEFQSVTFTPGGTNVGTTQYADAFQRANFWNYVSTGSPNYHVLLSPSVQAPVTVNISRLFGKTVAGPCTAGGSTNNGAIGLVALNYFNLQLRGLSKQFPSNTLPLFIFYNTFFYEGNANNCCVLGYHTAFGRAPNQLTVAVAAFSDPGIFSVPIQDIHALSHEIGEWMDDPFINNTVPGWTGGQIGNACSTVLEVGDPVTGIAFEVNLNGFTYHPEDLVFLPWFEKVMPEPTNSVNGWYTFLNSFSAPSVTCQ